MADLVGFADVAPALGVADTNGGHGYGVNFIDVNQDGLVDLVFPNHTQQLQLFQQLPNHSVTDVATAAGLTSIPLDDDKHGAAWGDCNNDGKLDMYVAVGFERPNLLYANNGNNSFTNVAAAAGVADNGRGRSSAWIDVDNDRYLDLFVTNGHLDGSSDKLYHNNGDCTFTDVTAQAGDLTTRFHRLGQSWADYNHSGLMSVFAAAGSPLPTDLLGLDVNSQLYRNNGNGTFTNVSAAAGIIVEPATGMAWGDFNNDGCIDLFVTRSVVNRLYRNNCNGTFTEVAKVAGVAQSLTSQNAVWADFNNDGYLDLYVVNAGDATAVPPGGAPNFLYLNNHDGTFREVAAQVGAQGMYDVNGNVAAGDFFGDGNVDLMINKGLGIETGAEAGQHILFQNHGNTANNTWLEVWLAGTASNSLGTGARLQLTTDTGLTMYRQQNGGTHQFAQDSLVLHFGLAQSQRVANLTITWPSGIIQTLTNVTVNQRIRVVEGRANMMPGRLFIPFIAN